MNDKIRIIKNQDPKALAAFILQGIRSDTLPERSGYGEIDAILCLSGDLGAGKTTLTQEICKLLHVEEDVVSPTFTIVNNYTYEDSQDGTVCDMNHLDLYRLDHVAELEQIGFYDIIHSGEFTIIEWADKFADQIPEDALWIELGFDQEGNRIAKIPEDFGDPSFL